MEDVRVMHFINQFFAGIGGEDKAHVPVGFREGTLGPGSRLQSLLGDSAKIVVTVYCGDNYFAEHHDEALEKILHIARDYDAGLVVAGPAFEIGVWNAWIPQVLVFVTMFTPNPFLSEEGKKRNRRMASFAPSNRIEKVLAQSTHLVIWPFVILYSIFVPLKLGTAWLYVGLLIFILGLAMQFMTTTSVANTPLNKPLTQGSYRILRHPIYLSGFLILVGTGIASASWLILLCALLWIAFFYIVVPAEERFHLRKEGVPRIFWCPSTLLHGIRDDNF